MKAGLFIIAAVIVLTSALTIKEKRDLNCDDVLSVKLCTNFKSVATKLKLKADIVEEAVRDAYKNGLVKSNEIITSVEKFLKEKIADKDCADYFDKKFCDQIDATSAFLGKKGKAFNKWLVAAYLRNAEKGLEIKDEIKRYIQDELLTKTCVDILPVDKCQKIEEIGKSLKLTAEDIKKATVEGIMKGYHKVEDTLTGVFNNMKEYAEKFTCEELFNPDVCKDMRMYATKLKIAMPKMMWAAKTALVSGFKVGKGFSKAVYKIADAFIDCEDFLSDKNCAKLKDVATKLGTGIDKIHEALKIASEKGIKEAERIYKISVDYLKNLFGKRKRSVEEIESINNLINDNLAHHLINKRGITSSIKDWLRGLLVSATGKTRDVILGLIERPVSWLLLNTRTIVKLIGETADDETMEYSHEEIDEDVNGVFADIADDVSDIIENSASRQRRSAPSDNLYVRKVVYDTIKKFIAIKFEQLTLNSTVIVNDVISEVKRAGGLVDINKVANKSVEKYSKLYI